MSTVHAIDSSSLEEALERFPEHKIADGKDRHGKPIKGRVLDVRQGSKVALVTIEPEPAGPGNNTGD